MSEPLIIVGAGGFGRETLEAVRALNAIRPQWDVIAVADDDPARHGMRLGDVEVIGPIDDIVAAHADARVVVCTNRPDSYFSRARIVARLGLPPHRYATVVHPAATVASDAPVGPGSVLLAGVVVTAAACIGAHVAMMPGVVVTHDDVVEPYATLASGVKVGGEATIGRGAYIGAGVLVRERVHIGAWSMVGMGSVVLDDVPPGELWFGTPARFRRRVDVPDEDWTGSP